MTADELALLRGVEAAPDDDLLRLVYADWLDEQGRHARAEFIRVQCELAAIERRLPTMTLEEKSDELRRRGWLQNFESEMLEAHRDESLGLPVMTWWEWASGLSESYSRGFAMELSLTPNLDLIELLQHSWEMIPRPSVSVCCLDLALQSEEARAVFGQSELWRGVTELHLGYPNEDYRPRTFLPQDFIPITRPDYPALRVFSAEYSQLNPGHVCVVAERLKAPKLEKLLLGDNDIVDSGLAFLHRAVYAPVLKAIDLTRNPLCRPEARWLTPDRLPSLRRLDLRECPIMPDSLARLRGELPLVEVLN